MSLSDIIYSVLIEPLELFFEFFFSMITRLSGKPGISIILLSIAINFLVLPLYRRADSLAEEERLIQERMSGDIKHIKKTFSGEERMMMLQTYYRQNGYKPAYSLRSLSSLMLQIPFFIAAYHFLSGLAMLDGASFGPIKDLGSPDALLCARGVTVNLLPFLMTLVNVVSGAIYSKGHSLKDKIQLYGIAAVFLVLLYNSPSGLVFYWTLNNLFSLAKNIISRSKHPGLVLAAISAAAGICGILIGTGVLGIVTLSRLRRIFFIGLGTALLLPLPAVISGRKNPVVKRGDETRPDGKIFLAGTAFLTVLIGYLIPSALVRSSPQEFVNVYHFYSPLWYVVSSLCIAAGVFTVWCGVFYWLAKPAAKRIFEYVIAALTVPAVVNYMFFGKNLGIISTDLSFENNLPKYPWQDKLLNTAVLAAAVCAVLLLVKKKRSLAVRLLAICIAAFVGMSAVNTSYIVRSLNAVELVSPDEYDAPGFSMSTGGRNVIVIMLDRAIGGYIPYIMNEREDLKEQFSGFTYYPNTVSYGIATNFGSAPLYGGYEYTPVEMNERSSEALADKQNEALRVLPVLFDRNGYNVTVCDPPYANYNWIPDLSIYDDYPDIKAYNTKGAFGADYELAQRGNRRNMFCYSLMKVSPIGLQSYVYDDGRYHNPSSGGSQLSYSPHISIGLSTSFTEIIEVLDNMPGMTDIKSDGSDNFMIMCNKTPHDITMLQEPEYEQKEYIDNTEYDNAHSDRFTAGGETLVMNTIEHYKSYQCNMAALLRLGEWFDYLRENGAYDNTRIILVADHGIGLGQFPDMVMTFDDGTSYDMSWCWPLLMVKDFGASGFTVSEEFMTNADTPALAVDGIIDSPVNPFTGKVLDSGEKTAHDQYIIVSGKSHVWENCGNTFLPGDWYTVRDDIRISSNWSKVAGDSVLDRKDVK